MTSCECLRSILTKVAEGEASPEETLGFARHIPDCTSCRILFARERHLARMLDGLDDLIPVEEAFLEGVMRSLPSTPPPRVSKRNGLKLAGIGAVMRAVPGRSDRRVGPGIRPRCFRGQSPGLRTSEATRASAGWSG
jgi:anti-sigma factor RsiW